MKSKPLVYLSLFILLLSTAVAAHAGDRWTQDETINAEHASDFRVSPDGRWAVWVKSVVDEKKNERVRHLMLSSLTGDLEIQLTRGKESASDPRWSPDGKYISFLMARATPGEEEQGEEEGGGKKEEPKEQVWVMRRAGGEPWPVTELEREVKQQEWADNDSIIFSAQELPALYEKELKEKKHDSIVVEDEAHEPPVRLFRVAVKDKKVTRLSQNGDWIESFAVAPDGKRVVAVHNRSLRYIYDNEIKPRTFLHDLEAGTSTEIFQDPLLVVAGLWWAPDGKGFYAATLHNSNMRYLYPTITLVHFYDVASGKTTKVDLDWENGLSGGLTVTPDGFVALLAAGARNKVARYARTGDNFTREWVNSDHGGNIFDLEAGKDGKTIVYEYSTASTPTRWYQARLDGANLESAKQFTHLNPSFKEKTIARSEVVRWKGALGDEVEGILYYPHGYQEGKKYPLVVMIHGGPAGADLDAWDEGWFYSPNLIAQRGSFVLRPNYHGSSNYGLAWAESIGGGKYYDLEVPDIEAGVDWLIERGMADPEKLGAMGWSNGSILTIALTVHSTRYKAASAGAGDVDWTSDWANAHFGAAFDNYYLGASPLKNPELYMKKSPFYELDKVRTPTIIFFGTIDTNVPTQQGWMHYRALQQLGNTDVRFLLFPGERHGFRKISNQKRTLRESLAWLDKHLFGTYEPGNEALKEGSPLALALKIRASSGADGRVGRVVKGKLVPETVSYQGLQLGRFEVTEAQYADFDPGYKVRTGKEDYPAHGISFEQAKAYADWLSKLTGESYRLPNADEAKKLYSKAENKENTLDYWADYTVNPDDAARLESKLKTLGPAALLKPVGSFSGSKGEEPVFDLGGNVAEWTTTSEGKSKAAGGSADTPADAMIRMREPAPEYVGLRVIRAGAEQAAAK